MPFTGRVPGSPSPLGSVRCDLDGVFSVNPFVVLLLEELLGRPEALAEIVRLDIKSVEVPSYCQTGGGVWTSCQTPVLLLFDRNLLLVLSLLSIGGGEEIKFFLAMTIHHPSYLMLLNYCVVFDQSALCTSKKLVILVIISQRE